MAIELNVIGLQSEKLVTTGHPGPPRGPGFYTDYTDNTDDTDDTGDTDYTDDTDDSECRNYRANVWCCK